MIGQQEYQYAPQSPYLENIISFKLMKHLRLSSMNYITEIHIFLHLPLNVTFTDCGIGIEASVANASATVPESAPKATPLDILV
jgi:hypothetical protein